MLKIGATDWGQCPKCIHYDDEHGCKIIEDITIEPNLEKDAVYCIDGEIGEPDVPIGPEVWE
jgi:hypothetical protein